MYDCYYTCVLHPLHTPGPYNPALHPVHQLYVHVYRAVYTEKKDYDPFILSFPYIKIPLYWDPLILGSPYTKTLAPTIIHPAKYPSSRIILKTLNRDPASLNRSPLALLLLLLVAGDVVVVLTRENKDALLEVICEAVVLLALTVVLLATIDVEDISRDGWLRAVTFAVVFGAVEDFCPLVPLLMLDIAPESLAVSDELSDRPFPVLWQAGWVLWIAGAVVGIDVGGMEV